MSLKKVEKRGFYKVNSLHCLPTTSEDLASSLAKQHIDDPLAFLGGEVYDMLALPIPVKTMNVSCQYAPMRSAGHSHIPPPSIPETTRDVF
jgi:hypothetical protein